MNLRHSAVFASALALILCACPPGNSPTDGGLLPDGGKINIDPLDACSGGCSANQRCDTVKRTCVDACGGCDAGVCIKNMTTMTFECTPLVTTCNGNACEAGQVACLNGGCSCLGNSTGVSDSCGIEGKWCNGANCVPPRRYQECIPGAAPCPTGYVCTGGVPGNLLFEENNFICLKDCNPPISAACDRGDACATDLGCIPTTFFSNQDCEKDYGLPDGGKRRLTVPVSNTCFLKGGGGTPTEAVPSGNCTYQFFDFYTFNSGSYPSTVCRPPGAVTLGGTCKQDFTATGAATNCGTGMECVLAKGGDQGVCLNACNAAPAFPGFVPAPACGADEACTNIYRLQDDNAVLGACMKKCNVFDPAKKTCANLGTTPASCVPTTADGKFTVSLDGSGVCIPQQTSVANEGQPCTELNAFKGATCATGLVCAGASATTAPTCVAVCDTACDDATPPARCATESGATCAGGKKCSAITSTTGAILGFCK